MRERLLEIIKENGLTAWKFAEILGVQASSISHILSGRNKPSFDFIEKILVKFPEISSDWLILGKGDMYRVVEEEPIVAEELQENDSNDFQSIEDEIKMYQVDESLQSEMFTNVNEDVVVDLKEEKEENEPQITDVNNVEVAKNEQFKEIIPIITTNKEIEKIIVFYKCKTFDIYTPES